jgi:RNA polymerase subunit RPABC4/transcription elongation factor Spt4
MKCPRCHGENFSRMTGLALVLSDVAGQPSVGVIGIHCRKCNLLMLEMSPGALPKDSIKEIANEWGGAAL